MAAVNITTPVGRLIQGSLYTPYDKDQAGNPKLVKSGPNMGKPKVDYFFAVAIPKEPGHTHWAQTKWGAEIWRVGHTAFPQGQAQAPTFAWKIVDGDSQIANTGTPPRRPCDMEGAPGCWVLKFTSGFAPKICNADGSALITEPNAVKLGYYVQVAATVDGNGNLQKPGVYLNHNAVALAAYGPEIVVGVDVSAAGFGAGAPLPPGASLTPVGGFTAPAVAGAPIPGTGVPLAPAVPAAPHAPTTVYAPPPATGAPPVVPSEAIQPNPAFLAVPVVPVAPVVAGPQLTAKAQGATYQQLIAAGWNDALLRANGLML